MGGGRSANVLSNASNTCESTWDEGSTQLDIKNMSFTPLRYKVGKGRKPSRIKWERKVFLGTTTQYISGERTGKALDNAPREDLYNASKCRSCDLLELTCINNTQKTTLFILVRDDTAGDTHDSLKMKCLGSTAMVIVSNCPTIETSGWNDPRIEWSASCKISSTAAAARSGNKTVLLSIPLSLPPLLLPLEGEGGGNKERDGRTGVVVSSFGSAMLRWSHSIFWNGREGR